jgi:pimeloyl-ACP methyl ester carboxylesterase
VLVHGAFVDASSWNGVIAELKAAGLDVVAPPNLLRGVGVDAAYLTGFVEALGRRVVLVGHSYAGAVISQTGKRAGSEVTEIDASHAVLATHPAEVAAVIARAVKAIG